MDRGYPAWWLFSLLTQKGIAFCARLDCCGCATTEVAAFLRSGKAEIIVTRRHLSTKAMAQLVEAGGLRTQDMTLQVRLVRVVMPTGRIEVLATSLLDVLAYPAQAFAELYGSRWKIEEAFKTLKHRLHLEGFTGELPDAIEQEIHAKVMIANITAALASQAHAQLPDEKAAAYLVNQTMAIKHWPALVVLWLKKTSNEFEVALLEFISMLKASLNKSRPDRKCPRNFSLRGAAAPRRAYH